MEALERTITTLRAQITTLRAQIASHDAKLTAAEKAMRELDSANSIALQLDARIKELEGQLDAVGAGGVEPLRKREEKLCQRCTPVCQGGEGCFSGMPQATHVRMVAFDVQPVEDEFVTREGWVESAMRVYLIAGDSEGQARECAEYLWVEADMDDLPDPIAAAMEDVEGRGP